MISSALRGWEGGLPASEDFFTHRPFISGFPSFFAISEIINNPRLPGELRTAGFGKLLPPEEIRKLEITYISNETVRVVLSDVLWSLSPLPFFTPISLLSALPSWPSLGQELKRLVPDFLILAHQERSNKQLALIHKEMFPNYFLQSQMEKN